MCHKVVCYIQTNLLDTKSPMICSKCWRDEATAEAFLSHKYRPKLDG